MAARNSCRSRGLSHSQRPFQDQPVRGVVAAEYRPLQFQLGKEQLHFLQQAQHSERLPADKISAQPRLAFWEAHRQAWRDIRVVRRSSGAAEFSACRRDSAWPPRPLRMITEAFDPRLWQFFERLTRRRERLPLVPRLTPPPRGRFSEDAARSGQRAAPAPLTGVIPAWDLAIGPVIASPVHHASRHRGDHRRPAPLPRALHRPARPRDEGRLGPRVVAGARGVSPPRGHGRDPYRANPTLCSLDRSIFQIRSELIKEFQTENLDFYLPPLRARWLTEEEEAEAETGAKTAKIVEEEVVGSAPRYWIEKTIVKGRPDRQEGPHKVGLALWSPHKSADGRDIYSSMREVAPGDVVFHLTDNSANHRDFLRCGKIRR